MVGFSRLVGHIVAQLLVWLNGIKFDIEVSPGGILKSQGSWPVI